MNSNFPLLALLLCAMMVAACSPNNTSATYDDNPAELNIGDPAPPLLVREWLKGEAVPRFEKGRIYLIELWATWCLPCKAAMPHLSDLARQYKDRVTVIGVDIKEKKTTAMEKVRAFVDSMGNRMDYTVAIQDSNFVEINWLDASGERGIPESFVVNAEGKLAWMGHPSGLDRVLSKIINNTWDIQEALSKRNSDRYLRELEDSLNYDLMKYRGSRLDPNDPGRPDSVLSVVDEIIRQEPRLKYAPRIAMHTFDALLKTNPHKAYEYGKIAIVTPTYQQPAYDFIIDGIDWYTDKLKLPPEIYRLGAEAYQAQINDIVYPELVNMPKRYSKMAQWYWKAGDKVRAIEALQSAIEMLKDKKDFSKADLMAYESRLQEYRKQGQ